jgi:hypothetical protein
VSQARASTLARTSPRRSCHDDSGPIGIRGTAWQPLCAHWLWKIPKTTACCCCRSCGAAATPALAPQESLLLHSCSLVRSWRCLTIHVAIGARARWRTATVARHKSRPSFLVRQIGFEKKGNCSLETCAGRRGTTSSHISNPNRTKRESKAPALSQFSNCKHQSHHAQPSLRRSRSACRVFFRRTLLSKYSRKCCRTCSSGARSPSNRLISSAPSSVEIISCPSALGSTRD